MRREDSQTSKGPCGRTLPCDAPRTGKRGRRAPRWLLGPAEPQTRGVPERSPSFRSGGKEMDAWGGQW